MGISLKLHIREFSSMFPFSRGKRILEMSLKSQGIPKRQKLATATTDEAERAEDIGDVSLLDISNSKLMHVPDDADISFSINENISLNHAIMPSISSTLKVANYVLNNCQVPVDQNNENEDPVDFYIGDIVKKKYGSYNVEVSADGHENLGSEEGLQEDQRNVAAILKERICDTLSLCSNNKCPDNPGGDENHGKETFDSVNENFEENSFNEKVTDKYVNAEESDKHPPAVQDGQHDVDTAQSVNEESFKCPAVRDGQHDAETTNLMRDATAGDRKEKTLTKKVDNKLKRQYGKPYVGRCFDKEQKKIIEVNKEGKVLGERCACKAAYYSCSKITDEDRQKIHTGIWQMSWGEKQVFVKGSVESHDVIQRKGLQEVSRRNKSLKFYLKGTEGRQRVCKQMYVNTTGLTAWWVLKTIGLNGNDEAPMADSTPNTGQVITRKPAGPSPGVLLIRQFLDALPKMPSHYCRKDTNKIYLEPLFKSFADLYREYEKFCSEKSMSKMSNTVFVEQLKSLNISLYIPRKDRCDLCCEYEQGNKSEELYQQHRLKKEAAQEEKRRDKNQASDSRTKVICVDVQRVLLSPSLKASALYYKTKLQLHNYTLYDLVTRDVSCYIWNECEGALTASEFASCLVSYLEENKSHFDEVIIYSDGCTYQNRNRFLATALRYFCVKYKKTVVQKILERGHTQMEVDSVHATIERRLKNTDIFSPLDYVQLIKAARINPRPYTVHYLSYDFFYDFESFGEGAVKSLKPKEANVNIVALKYHLDGTINYKLDFADNWQDIRSGCRSKLPLNQNPPSKLYKNRRKIKKNKYDHLQSLKSVLPADVHPFYDSLPHF